MPTPDRLALDGRTLITRAEICRSFDISTTTAERWWQARESNGHPPVVHREGRRLWWDESEMKGFLAHLESPSDRLTVEGRLLLSRAALARRFNKTQKTMARLYSERHENGHPEPAQRRGQRLYWDAEAMEAWESDRQASVRDGLTPVDRRGDAAETVDVHQAAQILGYSDAGTIRSFRSRNRGYFPDPDADGDDGRPRWRRDTLWSFADRRNRPGRAGHSSPDQQ